MLDELARHRVHVAFADAPAIDDDPQAKLLTQVQGVIAEFSVISTRRDAGLPDVRVAA